MNPVSKESQLFGWQPGPKPKKPISKVSKAGKFRCSDGTTVSQAQIDYLLRKAYDKTRTGMKQPCEACGINEAFDHDHTISQARCKALHNTELIWDFRNWSMSCRECHNEWESYRSGTFEEHTNVVDRMLFLKLHDPEAFEKRKQCLSDHKVLKAIK